MSIFQLFSSKKKSPILFYFSSLLIWSIASSASAQTYSLRISDTNFTLDGQRFSGYATDFVQPYKQVNKEWWRYVNARTIIFNKKSHLVLTVPAKGKDANEPLKFVAQLTENKQTKQSTLKVALLKEGVPANQVTELSKQVKYLLKDFKVSYFTTLVQAKINHQEQAVKKISQEMDDYLLDNSKLQMRIEKRPDQKAELARKLQANTAEIEKLQSRLATNQKKLAQYKKELTLIK